MYYKFLIFTVPIIALAMNIIFQVFSVKFFSLKVLRSVFLGFGSGLVFIFASACFGLACNFLFLLSNIAIYCLLGYCYFHFVNLGETARRVRILRELADSSGGLTLGELLLRYNAGEIVENRLERLSSNNQIFLRDGKYYVGKPVVLLIARIILFMQGLLAIKKR